jgi:ABC-type Fe3+/spermidine/putrescine transport system ATPase subunit
MFLNSGVSGGQRRRVTVGEMLVRNTPISCGDEISTGLDAATTYSIIRDMVGFAKLSKTTRIISLLQPGPETYSLFDEVILLADGYVIYAGPIDQVEQYFEELGYPQKSTMDVADFLQLVATSDGAFLFDESKRPGSSHLTPEQFAAAFRESDLYKKIRKQLDQPSKRYHWKDVPEEFQVQYQNSYCRSIQLNFRRHLTLWKRDWGFIIGKIFENIGMAVATGGILFGAGKIPWSEGESSEEFLANEEAAADQIQELQAGIYGALFMTSFHILLGKLRNGSILPTNHLCRGPQP